MSKFYNLEGQSVVVEAALDDLRPVHEGWGEAIGNLVSMFVPAVAGTLAGKMAGEKIGGNGLIGGFLGGAGGYLLGFFSGVTGLLLFNAATAKKFIKIIEHPKVKEYLLQEADKIYKEVKKKDKSVVTKWDDKDKDLEKAAEKGELDVPGFMSSFKYMKDAEIEVGNYSILLMGDHEELKRIVLVLYSNNAYHLILKDITVPSKEQINEWLKEEAVAKESMEIAEEGWGTAVAIVGTAAGARLSGIIGHKAAGAISLGSFAAGKYINIKSNGDLAKLFSIDELKNYVKEQCDKILKEEQEKDPSVTPSLPGGIIKWIKKHFTDKKIGWAEAMMNSGEIKTEVGPYSVYAIGDTDSIGKITVMLYSKDKNNFFVRVINPPTKEFIAQIKSKY